MSKCSGEHQHAWGKDGHAHGHGTMWFEGDPNKPHHHHDLTCLHDKDAEISRLEAEVKLSRENSRLAVKQLHEVMYASDVISEENARLEARVKELEEELAKTKDIKEVTDYFFRG